MPKEIENSLKQHAKHMGLKGEHYDAYVYGTMNRIEKRKKSDKGEKKKEHYKEQE